MPITNAWSLLVKFRRHSPTTNGRNACTSIAAARVLVRTVPPRFYWSFKRTSSADWTAATLRVCSSGADTKRSGRSGTIERAGSRDIRTNWKRPTRRRNDRSKLKRARSGQSIPVYPLVFILAISHMATVSMPMQFRVLLHRIQEQFARGALTENTLEAFVNSPSIQQAVRFNCTKKPATTTTPKPARKYRGPVAPKWFEQRVACLGELFENFTNISGPARLYGVRQPYNPSPELGEIVYMMGQKASFIIVRSDKSAIFDGGNGFLDIYSPMDKGGKRRVEVRVFRAEFTPKLVKPNITGSIKVTDLQLAPAPPQSRMVTLNSTTQLGRTYDGKPIVQVVECKAELSRYRVEISYERLMFRALENCSLEVCIKTSKYYEEAICKLFENFVMDVINRKLQLYPTRVDVTCEMHRVDYSQLNNEPNVTDQCIQAGLEGTYIWRRGSAVPFYPAELRWVENNRMLSFELADFAFNTLFYQAHIQGHRISAATLNSSSVQQALSFSCPDKQATTTTLLPARKYRGPAPKPRFVIGSILTVGARKVACLGELFENFTSASGPAWQHVRQLTESDTGDIVYKTGQKANWIMVQSVNNAIFDGSNGVLEIYSRLDKSGNRQLLARVDVRSLREEFTPKLNKANIAGSIKIANLQLAPAPPQSRMINSEWLDKLTEFVAPILEEMYNDFLDKLAQYSIPLPAHYTCASPTFSVQPRTMQIDCDIERSTRRIIPVMVG